MTKVMAAMMEELERLCIQYPDTLTAIEINVKGDDGEILHGFNIPSEMLTEKDCSHATHYLLVRDVQNETTQSNRYAGELIRWQD